MKRFQLNNYSWSQGPFLTFWSSLSQSMKLIWYLISKYEEAFDYLSQWDLWYTIDRWVMSYESLWSTITFKKVPPITIGTTWVSRIVTLFEYVQYLSGKKKSKAQLVIMFRFHVMKLSLILTYTMKSWSKWNWICTLHCAPWKKTSL